MAFLKFPYRAKNELEKGGRNQLPAMADENEPTQDCPNCHKSIPLSKLWAQDSVCACGYHFRMKARHRIGLLADEGTFCEAFSEIVSSDPLGFPDYRRKLSTVQSASGEREAVVCGRAKIGGHACYLFAMDPYFMMGSMGAAVGEKITRTFEAATAERLPVVGCALSGGARMQEALASLRPTATTCGALRRHSDAGLLYIALLSDPTTGGVTASFAMGGDIILAEPGATIGFAGTRVIEQTTHKALPKTFQKSEFLLEHGFVDAIVARSEQKAVIGKLLALHEEEDHEQIGV